jgi:Cu(I)/Ag(I) efflux system protein CusF
MKTIQQLHRAAMRAGVAGVSFGAGAVDDAQRLRAEVDALKPAVRQLPTLIQGSREQVATTREVPAPHSEAREAKETPATVLAEGRSINRLGTPVAIYGTLNADEGTVERTGATTSTSAFNSMVRALGASPTNVPSRYARSKTRESIKRVSLILAFAWSGAAFAQHSHGDVSSPARGASTNLERGALKLQPLFFDGEVRAVDKASGKVTLKHASISSLDMPATTAAYSVKDASMLDQVEPGDKVRFTGVLQARLFIVTKMEPAN